MKSPLSSLFAAVLVIIATAVPECARAHDERVPIPQGEPMAPNPVAPRGRLVAKKAMFAGVERSWYEYVPASYNGKRLVPLVVAIHGGSADGRWMFGATAWGQVADKLGFIVIYPNGSIGKAGKLRWNAFPEFNTGPDMALSADNQVDEARFLKELIEQTETRHRIDARRIYMHGQSNGGMMTSYFGLRYPEIIAAMGVGSAPPSTEIMAKYPIRAAVPTYFWGGETDTVAGQYNPAGRNRAELVKQFSEYWAGVNKADPDPSLRLDGAYNTKIYAGDAEVRGTEFRNGVHSLPFTAAYMVWNDFFSRYRRGPKGEVVHIVPDDKGTAPRDSGAVVLKLGSPFAMVDNRVVRIGNSPDETPILIPGAPSAGVSVPAEFIATAFGLTFHQDGADRITLKNAKGTAEFTVGTRSMLVDGKEVVTDIPTRNANGTIMVSLGAAAGDFLGKTISTRKDVYRNDVYYISDRAADVSAQTIAYADRKLGSR